MSRSKPNQATVDEWMRAYYQRAHDKGRCPPRRKEEAFPDCRAAIGATDVQMREAMLTVPDELKNFRGRFARVRETYLAPPPAPLPPAPLAPDALPPPLAAPGFAPTAVPVVVVAPPPPPTLPPPLIPPDDELLAAPLVVTGGVVVV